MEFVKHRNSQNILPLDIENKESYYLDLLNIENSWTGRLDAQVSNTFFLESIQLIINSIELFERGYFDCAFYSLRQSLEVSLTIAYLIDGAGEKREEELSKWKEQGRFPMYSAMVKTLEKNESVYREIREFMKEYFLQLELTKKKLNKYVHKQGFSTFYTSKNHPFNKSKSRTKFVKEYEGHLIKCIGAIAVMRLTIDPFPILLMDKEIYRRTGDILTFQYSNSFVEKYIGIKNIEAYKKTEFYRAFQNSIMEEDAKSDVVVKVVKEQFIDKSRIDEIFEQQHLLSNHDFAAVILAGFSSKVANVYSIGGLNKYFTTTDSKRESWSFNGLDFKKFDENHCPYNMKYDKAFISRVYLLGDTNYLEHNTMFDKKEILKLKSLIEKYNTK
ncbi:hypothetical protein BFP71_17175 [Roseivirga misakiensis]|uniref:Teicoplanin resistance protein VanZ n=1 Tax=Roseivirga misakiensis TaxID=1563681 RepID=A0A1E5T2P6_9BACT|nr:hypothetical protein BFP71_17175 [Roseivirga misakiensis]